MNRTIKDATVKHFHCEGRDHLRLKLASFVDVYNYAQRLKALKGLTLCEAICRVWTKKPGSFTLDPLR